MKRSQIALGVAAAFGVTIANAEVIQMTLTGANSETSSGSSAGIVDLDTASWSYDTTSGILTGSGQHYEQYQIVPIAPGQLFSYTASDLVVGGGGAASATSFACIEGFFGSGVGASLCANYSFGTNGADESTATWGPGLAYSRTIGGDDSIAGVQQTLSVFDGMSSSNDCDINNTFAPFGVTEHCNGSWDGTTLVMSNAVSATSGLYMTLIASGEAVDDVGNLSQGTANADFAIGANDRFWSASATVVEDTAGDQGGSFTINNSGTSGAPGNVTVTYAPADPNNAPLTETWVYRVTDTTGDLIGQTNTATLTVNVNPFGANDDNGATERLRKPVLIPTGANDIGFTDPSIVTITIPPTQGTTTINGSPGSAGDVTIEYVSDAALFSAPFTDTFTYRVEDNAAVIATAEVTVQVNNTIPVAGDLTGVTLDTQGVNPASVSTTINVGVGGDIAGNAIGDAVAVVTTTPSNDVTSTVLGTQITIQATAFTSAGDAVGYTITDADGETDTGTISLAIPDVVPQVSDVSSTINVPGTFTISLGYTLGNGAASDHTITVSTPQIGTVENAAIDTIAGTVSFDYTPAGAAGPEVLTVDLTDGNGSIGSGTATITMVDAAVTIPLQDTPPGQSSAIGPAGLGLLFAIPLLRNRRRKR
jgi:hypothetical protein